MQKIKNFFALIVDIIYYFFVTFIADIFGWDVTPNGINGGESSGGNDYRGHATRVGGGNIRGGGIGQTFLYRAGAGG